MDSARWQQVDRIFAAALERPPERRAAYLEDVCAGDLELQREVESLLDRDRDDRFLEEPASAEAARLLVEAERERLVGRLVGRFEVLSVLGAGGMGEVYLAHDPKLERRVAIKLVPRHLAGDPEFIRRFRREALAISALNHPNILTVFEVLEDRGQEFLVTELVEGSTLKDRLRSGPLPLVKALEVATQMARGLAAAHSVGIVHRDVKPANVMVRNDGLVKLLDFGLAKNLEGPSSEETTFVGGGGPGPGTPAYLSPEQARGEAAGTQSDVWALGCVLYEILTGRRAFEGPTMTSVLLAIQELEPDWQALPAQTPFLVRRLVRRCLEKDVDRRYHHMADVRLELEAAMDEPQPTGAPNRRRERMTAALAGIATLAAIGLGLALVGRDRPEPRDERVRVLSMLAPDGAALAYGEAPQISPDGRLAAFVAADGSGTRWLYVRDLASSVARPLAGTESASMPFWSPDSRRLGFFAHGRVKTIAAAGGVPHAIAEAPVPRGGSWSRHDEIVYVALPSRPLQKVAATGGPVVAVPMPEEASEFRFFPVMLPDGRHYLYLALERETRKTSIRVASLDSTEVRELVPSRASAVYAPPGYLLFLRESSLVAQRFDDRRLDLLGTPEALVDGLAHNPITWQAQFSASGEGTIAYRHATARSELAWLDLGGRSLGTAATGDYNTVCLAAGDRRIVYEAAEASGSVDLWALEVGARQPSRLTFDNAVDFYPVCSPSGDEIVFASLRDGPPNLFRLALGAPGSETRLLASPFPKIPTDWSRDETLLVYSVLNPATSWDIAVLPLAGGEPLLFAQTDAEERNARLSPDGRWMAYVSNESGAFEVFVQPFPPTGAKWQITSGGGLQPQWRRDGTGLVLLTPANQLLTVDVGTRGSELVPGEARSLLTVRTGGWEPYSQGSQYALAQDGSRVLVSQLVAAPEALHLTLDWPAALADP